MLRMFLILTCEHILKLENFFFKLGVIFANFSDMASLVTDQFKLES